MVFDLQPPEDDGLHMDSVGSWSADKHHFLKRYIDAFTTSKNDYLALSRLAKGKN